MVVRPVEFWSVRPPVGPPTYTVFQMAVVGPVYIFPEKSSGSPLDHLRLGCLPASQEQIGGIVPSHLTMSRTLRIMWRSSVRRRHGLTRDVLAD